MNNPPRVFITYAHADGKAKDELIERLEKGDYGRAQQDFNKAKAPATD